MPAKHVARIGDEEIYCHIYNKGVEKITIFNDDEDYKVFTGYVQEYLAPPIDPKSKKKVFKIKGHEFKGTPHLPKNYFKSIELIAFSLSADHFHLILHQTTKNSIQSFIRSLCTRYSMYFNKKYHRNGTLFEGPYKSGYTKDTKLIPPLVGFIQSHGQTYFSIPQFSVQTQTNNEDLELIKALILEAPVKTETETKHPTSATPHYENLGHLQRIPEIFTLTTIFILLVGVGLRNIAVSASDIQTPNSPRIATPHDETPAPDSVSPVGMVNESSESAVLAVATDSATIATPSPPPIDTESALFLPTPLPSASPSAIVVVKITDGSKSINIRKSPTTFSEVVSQAHEGDTFEFISKNVGWYEVKISDQETGFISPKYSFVQQNNN